MKQPTSQTRGMTIGAIVYGMPVNGRELRLCTDEALQEAYANARVTMQESEEVDKRLANFELQERWYFELQKRKLSPDGREGVKNGNGTT